MGQQIRYPSILTILLTNPQEEHAVFKQFCTMEHQARITTYHPSLSLWVLHRMRLYSLRLRNHGFGPAVEPMLQ
eukprot:6181604-Pleurochrysis_carterae.AAC.1